jgi:hypothetical protein
MAHQDEGTMAAAAATRAAFARSTPPYMPHLSLLYADIPQEQRSKVRTASSGTRQPTLAPSPGSGVRCGQGSRGGVRAPHGPLPRPG